MIRSFFESISCLIQNQLFTGLTVFWRLLLAHLIVDFIMQTNKMVSSKTHFKTLLHHCSYLLVISLIFVLDILSVKILLIILFITLLHGLIDFLKARIEQKIDTKWDWVLFTADQALHVIVIILGISIFYPFTAMFFLKKLTLFAGTTSIFQALSFILLITVGGSYFTASVCKRFSEKLNNEESLQNAGKYIGVLERIIVAASILSGRYEIIGFLIAAKSIIRHREANDRAFTEYFLIGTFSSTIWAGVVTILFMAVI